MPYAHDRRSVGLFYNWARLEIVPPHAVCSARVGEKLLSNILILRGVQWNRQLGIDRSVPPTKPSPGLIEGPSRGCQPSSSAREVPNTMTYSSGAKAELVAHLDSARNRAVPQTVVSKPLLAHRRLRIRKSGIR